ncbi:AvrD family protein [Streptomyces sp. NBC_00080]|uniref:AvrD family protein n=1 Tax=unclassified Streptomyces TaxID=2593676 RepID=UPI00114F1E67|nr:AvrD family protein [Streptomyces sp. SLBN-115]TQJ37150.1 avirulence D protein (AvrD) [Streptomyces sp. SLBN-115]
MPSLELASIDDFLGPRDSRFLGEGFKRVERSLNDLTVSPGDEGVGGIQATARIAIPGLWSRKGEQSPQPHLSTIDAMLFGAQLTGLYAAHTLGLTPDARFTVQRVDLKAGARPDEDHLEAVPVSGRLVAAQRAGEEWATTLDCRIGSLTARVHARHSPGRTLARTDRVYAGARELAGPWNHTPYGISHHARRQLLTGVRVSTDDQDDLRATARVTLARDPAHAVPPDAPATMIDAFVAALQLGQVLLYTLDGIDRAHSNNLWMRRTRVTAGPALPRPADEVSAALEQTMLLPSPVGTWRTAEVVGSLHGVQARAGVGHLLPQPSLSAASPGRSGR